MKQERSFLDKAKIVVDSLAGQLRANVSEPVNIFRHGLTCRDKQPRDTVIVEDVSGSMDLSDYPPTRLDGGIEAAVEYINVRSDQCPNDRLAVVAFDHTAWVVIGLTSITNIDRLIKAVYRLKIRGGTDIAKGLDKTVDIFRKNLDSANNRQVILLTDGHGGNPLITANKLKNEYRAVIDVVGIGGSRKSVNEKLLRKVATTDPDGFNHYRFIKDPRALKMHYRNIATGLIWRGDSK